MPTLPLIPLIRSLARPEVVSWRYVLAGLDQAGLDDLIQFAALHQLLPVMAVRWTPHHGLPTPLREALKPVAMQTWARNQRKLKAWRAIGSAFQDASMPVMALKGVYFSEHLYRDSAARPMGDLDLMIRVGDEDAVSAILTGLGYLASPKNAPDRKELWFDHPESGLHLDVHLSLETTYAAFSLPADELWQRAVVTSVNGVTAHVLSPADQFCHFALHATLEHAYMPARLLLDLVLAWQRWGADVDWDELAARAASGQMTALLASTVAVAAELNGDPVPAAFDGQPATQELRAWVADYPHTLSSGELKQLTLVRLLLSRLLHGKRLRHMASSEQRHVVGKQQHGWGLLTPLKLGGLAVLAVLAWGQLALRSSAHRRAAVGYVRLIRTLHQEVRRRVG